MASPIRLAFSGRFDFEQLDVPFDSREDLLRRLQEHSRDVASDIQRRLLDSIGLAPEVQISFTEGSIEWHGLVQWAAAAWPTIEVMAGIGGAIQLVQIVRNAVNSVLERWFTRSIQTRHLPLPLETQVVVISMPSGRADVSRSVDPLTIFAVAAFLIGLAAMVASIGYLISVVR